MTLKCAKCGHDIKTIKGLEKLCARCFCQSQVDAIDNAIKQWNERRQYNISGGYGDPNSVEAIQKFRYANNQIKFLQKERAKIKGQMILLETQI